MTNEDKITEKKDEVLWSIAKKRVAFRKSFATYVIINLFLWAIWYFTNDNHSFSRNNIPWPIWSTLGWGIGIAFQYNHAYISPGQHAVEKEYEKLKGNKQ